MDSAAGLAISALKSAHSIRAGTRKDEPNRAGIRKDEPIRSGIREDSVSETVSSIPRAHVATQDAVKAAEERATILDTQIIELQTDKERLEAQVRTLLALSQETLKASQHRTAALEAQIASLKAKTSSVNSGDSSEQGVTAPRHSELQSIIDQYDTKLTEANMALQSANEDKKTLRQQVSKLQVRVTELSISLKGTRLQLNTSKEHAQALQNDKEQLEAKLRGALRETLDGNMHPGVDDDDTQHDELTALRDDHTLPDDELTDL